MQHQHQLWSKKLSTSTNIFAATPLKRERDGFLALNLQSNFVELGFWIHQEFQGGFPPTFRSSLSRCYSENTITHMFLSLSLSLSLSGQWIYSKLLYLVLQAIEPTRSWKPCKKHVANDEMTTRSRLLQSSSSSRIRHEPVGRLVNSQLTPRLLQSKTKCLVI